MREKELFKLGRVRAENLVSELGKKTNVQLTFNKFEQKKIEKNLLALLEVIFFWALLKDAQVKLYSLSW